MSENGTSKKLKTWDGGHSPFKTSYGKMMMWFFLMSDALTFGSLITAYGFSRFAESDPWPIGEQVFNAMPFLHGHYPLMYVALMTFLLIISSVTMVLAVEAGHRKDNKGVLKWMALTVLGGVFFVSSQAWEWSHFIGGAGGYFQAEKNMTVNVEDEHGNASTYEIKKGERIFMDHDFGHELEHTLANRFERTDYAALGHEAHEEHGHDEHEVHAGHADPSKMAPQELMVKKFTLGKAKIAASDVGKVWANKSPNTYTFGANLHENEYGRPAYSRFFFFITGFHGFHVFSGVVINLIIFLMALRGVFLRTGHYEMVEKAGLYWHFVDLVWVFVFTFFYLV